MCTLQFYGVVFQLQVQTSSCHCNPDGCLGSQPSLPPLDGSTTFGGSTTTSDNNNSNCPPSQAAAATTTGRVSGGRGGGVGALGGAQCVTVRPRARALPATAPSGSSAVGATASGSLRVPAPRGTGILLLPPTLPVVALAGWSQVEVGPLLPPALCKSCLPAVAAAAAPPAASVTGLAAVGCDSCGARTALRCQCSAAAAALQQVQLEVPQAESTTWPNH